MTIDDPGPREVEQMMEELVYEHLIDLVDFDRMSSLEQVVGLQLHALFEKGQLAGDATELAERASGILERAWHRVIEDPRRYADLRGEWQPDADCELCRMLAEPDTFAGGDAKVKKPRHVTATW
ncbi:MAG: hypothetical protein ABI867_02525 [Kofleriaceae bacterium]